MNHREYDRLRKSLDRLGDFLGNRIREKLTLAEWMRLVREFNRAVDHFKRMAK
jgi:hypothetical protein